jgi:hypoxanthine phosphoribosyltransferase
MPDLTNNQFETLVSAEEISTRINEICAEIAPILDDDAVVIGLLQGAFIFMADIMRGLSKQSKTPSTDFLWLSSYGDTQVSGRLNIIADLQRPISGRQVLLVDDVYDTGKTLAFAKEYLKAKGAKEVLTCLLARKPEAAQLPPPDYLGFDLPNVFLVGYGLDDGGRGRGLCDICAMRPK